MLARLAELLVPPLCAICSAPCVPGDRICGGCDRALAAAGPLRFSLPGSLTVTSAVRYEGAGRLLVTRLKFAGRLALADVAAAAMARAADLGQGAVLVPVPPAPARARARGFDPAGLLSSAVAARSGCESRAWLRRDDGPRQVGRSRTERLAEAPEFRIAHGTQIAGHHACLVDDVVTTGGTLLAAAAALRAAGAERLGALTFARAE